MLDRRKHAILICLVMALAIVVLTSGCQHSGQEEETETETQSETIQETESETETEFQTNVVYISEDESIRIILPDSTWKVTQDLDEMRVFSSDSDAMINIVHASDENSMKNVSVMESEEELTESLANQYPEDDAFEILSFEERSSSTIVTYEYVVKYNYSTSMWAYSVTYAILSVDEDAAYVVTGTVTEDDETMLEAVQESVESFSVLDSDSIFSVLPGTVENNDTTGSESESAAEEDTAGSSELSSLSTYTQSITLYASSTVNIRKMPSTEADLLGSLAKGNSVTVTGETSQWYQVSINGSVGYISKAYLVSTQTETDADSDSNSDSDDDNDTTEDEAASAMTTAELGSEISYDTSYTYYTTDSVNLRSQPSTSSSAVTVLSSGEAVTVTGETDNWFIVSVNGVTGYISKAYVSSTQTTAQTETASDSSSTSDTTASTDASSDSSSSDTSASSTGVLSGTITAVSSDTILIEGDDGVTYSINYQNASLNSSGLSEGLYISATIDYSQSTSGGSLYATSVTGY